MNLLDQQWLSQSTSNKRWLVAVSGGRDSIALLHACYLSGLRNLVLCHVNHHLRGADSDADQSLVEKTAQQMGLEISVHRVDVGKVAQEEKTSMELTARNARHAAYSSDCVKHGCDGVLLAHHADDQAETVLYNLLRGSAGLKGMQAEKWLEKWSLNLYRPMLHVRRAEINDFIEKHNLEYREDTTNAEGIAVRNRFRNEVFPLLNEIMSRDVSSALLKNLAYSEQVENEMNQLVQDDLLDPEGRIFLPKLKPISRVIQQRFLMQYLNDHHVTNVSQALIEQALELVNNPDHAAKINLPGNLALRRTQQRIYIDAQ